MKIKNIATFYAVLAAVLYAINVPFSKFLLNHAQPAKMASFLYLGAGLGLFIYSIIEKTADKKVKREPLTKKELPYTIAMVVLDIAAPILLMFGISMSNSAHVSLLNNFEVVLQEVNIFCENRHVCLCRKFSTDFILNLCFTGGF